MPRLVHFAPASAARAIENGGVRGRRHAISAANGVATTIDRAVFAMPVLPDFAATHQWVRELRRWHDQRVVAVHFNVPRDEAVLVGHFGKAHDSLPLSEAVAWVRANPVGAEIVVARSIASREIASVREVRQLVGWIETPEARTHYDCVCIVCLPSGTPDAFRRIRAAYERWIQTARGEQTPEAIAAALGHLDGPIERARGRLSPKRLLSFASSPDAEVRQALASCLAGFRVDDAEAPLVALLSDPDGSVSLRAAESLLNVAGVQRASEVVAAATVVVRAAFPPLLEYARDENGAALALERFATDSDRTVRDAARRVIGVFLRDAVIGSELRQRLELLCA